MTLIKIGHPPVNPYSGMGVSDGTDKVFRAKELNKDDLRLWWNAYQGRQEVLVA